MAKTKDALKKYSPLFAIGFTALASMFKSSSQRYLVKRRFRLTWRDAGTALLAGIVGYVGFRLKQGNAGGAWYTR